jgi:hypothetical protein
MEPYGLPEGDYLEGSFEIDEGSEIEVFDITA